MEIFLVAGLPASGKDTVCEFFEKKDFFLMVYSRDVLKPIVNSPAFFLKQFIFSTIGEVSREVLDRIVFEIEVLKERFVGRDLYISVAQFLNKVVSDLTDGEFNHFTLFATFFYGEKKRIVVSGFRQAVELEILKKKFPDAVVRSVLVDCSDSLRFSRLRSRDGILDEEILRNEKFEFGTTFDAMMREVDFDFVIKNEFGLSELESQVDLILDS